MEGGGLYVFICSVWCVCVSECVCGGGGQSAFRGLKSHQLLEKREFNIKNC